MNRYRLKCMVGSLTGHLILLILLLVSPAFMRPQEKPMPDLPPIDYVPDRLVDQALYVPPPPEPQPEITEPPPEENKTPVIEEPPPEPEPVPEKKPEPKPVPKEPEKPKWQPNKDIKVSARKFTSPQKSRVKQTNPARQKQFDEAINSLRRGLSSRTEISYSFSGVAYANYAQEVLRRYREAWVPPSGNDVVEGMVQIEVVIRKDGVVLQSRIIKPSGQAPLNASVRRALDQVKTIAPFPAGAKENERTYKIKLYLETD